jgi:hypothetical protein
VATEGSLRTGSSSTCTPNGSKLGDLRRSVVRSKRQSSRCQR